MKNKNWSRYIPINPKYGEGVIYFKDEDGNDWNDSYPSFKKKYKFTYENDTGIIRSVSEEAGFLAVGGLSVADINSLPEGFNIIGEWIFDGKKIIQNIESLKRNAESMREKLSDDAEKRIKQLERAVRVGVATDDEKARLNALEMYSIELSRIDLSTAPDIKWPTLYS